MSKNTIEDMFQMYLESFRGTYVVEDGLDRERQAFVNGLIAAMLMLDVDPKDLINQKTGLTVEEEINEVLYDHADRH